MTIEDLAKKVEENARRLDENAAKINQNIESIKQNSLALDILRDYKKEARGWFFAFIIVTFLLTIICIHHFFV